ncbi:MAG: hypothetical protein KJP23_28220, partial [Deltaproteobacteria bacterium]|nr:hypothetical protein [Deltaproteobacteria bacterium]
IGIYATLAGLTLSAYSAFAQERDRSPAQRSVRGRDDRTEAPAPPPQGQQREGQQDTAASYPDEVRSIDGTANNLVNPLWGSAGVEFLRLTTVGYTDGSSAPSGDERLNAREISNACAAYDGDAPNTVNASDFLWQWGQFLDHDVAETPVADPAEWFDIEVPAGDPDFDPLNTGEVTIPLDRSHYNIVNGVRQQVNVITAFIDASNVYGSDEERALELRTLDSTGRLKTSEADLLPFNENGLENAPTTDASFFLAGDIRANEQVGLTAMHTLFVREHNYWADRMLEVTPQLNGDELYEVARAIVAAEMQLITYNEFLPLLLGRNGLRPYRGYRDDVNPGLGNAFATAAYRVGHTMLSSELLRLEADGSPIVDGSIALADAFFNPDEIINHGIEPYLRGMAAQGCQNVDSYVVDDVRNFLFGAPGAAGFDLVSLNIQRGRDHGLPGYNQVRRDYGLSPAQSFADMSSDPEVQANLTAVYDSPDEVDLWVGGLAEDHLPRALVGQTFARILGDQFERLRDGDRFWYEAYLPRFLLDIVERQTLAAIIRRNTTIGNELQDDVSRVATEGGDEGAYPPSPAP